MSAHLDFPRLDPDAQFAPDAQSGHDGPTLGSLDSFPPPAEAGQEPGWDELALSRLTLRSDASVHARRIAAASRWGMALGLGRVPATTAGDRTHPPGRRPRGSDFPPSLLSRLDGSVRSSVIAAALPAPPAVTPPSTPDPARPVTPVTPVAAPAPAPVPASLTLPRSPVVLTPAARPAKAAAVARRPGDDRPAPALSPLSPRPTPGQGQAGRPALSADADKVVRHLARAGVTPAAELKALLGKSQPTLSRVLRELGDRVVALGAARARRYALPQPLDGGSARLQLQWVDEAGQRQPWGELTLLVGDQVHVRGPELDLLVQGGLPWFLAPLQREGTYLGRLLDGLPSGQPWSLAAQLQAASRLGDAAGALVLQADLPASADAGQEAPFPTLDLSPPLLTSVVAAPSALVDLADRVELNEQLAGANSGQVALLSPSPSLPPTLPHTLPGGIPALASRIAAHPDQLPLPLRRRQASPASRLALYDRLAERLGQDLAQAAQESAAQGSTPGSAALPRGAWLGGSQPKLLCRLSDGGAEVVKFSPRLGNPLARRLSDLLHAEATALAVLAHAGVATAEAEILVSEERVYLVTQRIDRVPAPRPSLGPTGIPTSTAAAGTGGRRHIVSLAQAHQALVSAAPPRHWSATAQALALQKRLPSADAERIAFLQAYAQLIGSHPQRLHKLPLQVTDLVRGRFVLAPLYSLPAQRWRPDPLVQDDTALSPFAPDPAALASSARPWAALYWQTVAGSAEFSLAWRRLAQEMATRLER